MHRTLNLRSYRRKRNENTIGQEHPSIIGGGQEAQSYNASLEIVLHGFIIYLLVSFDWASTDSRVTMVDQTR